VGAVAALSPLLETRALSKTFGGLEAVRSADFRIDRGEIRALIGPNGAGKTTLVSMICGRLAPTSGRILFKNRDITRTRPDERVAFGIVYTFQVSSVFRHLTAFENVALAAQRRLMHGEWDHLALDRRRLVDEVERALEHTGLGGIGDRQAGSLPHGHQKLLELSMALALFPQVLVLDEPTQGLSAAEIAAFARLVRGIADATTVLLIEHNMRVVLDLSQRITVMDAGRIIAEGTPAEISANREVQRVYLGP
jgi:branched-chain amino acid transport system ATP-binding protein